MISIEGITTNEVFRNVAVHPEFDEDERRAAQIIADGLDKHERWQADRSTDEFEDDPVPTPKVGFQFHSYTSDTHVYTVTGTGITFVVRPYTTGNTMNVGVTRSHAEQA